MNIDHTQLETLAREICDTRNGAGHYDAKGTKRSHWRSKAAAMMAKADGNPAFKYLMRACGWML